MSRLEGNLLGLMINKLGLDQSLLSKGDEFLRLLQLKTTTNALISKCSDTARVILVLDITCSEIGLSFDKDLAIQLSGFKRRQYSINLELFKKILGLNRTLTIKELCIRANCSSIFEQCQRAFDKYKQMDKMGTKNFEHPQYMCIVVYVMCRLNKIKVQKSLFLELSLLKSAQWALLESEFSKFIEEVGIKESTKSLKSSLKDVEESVGKEVGVVDSRSIVEEEPYEVWKARMLKFAREV